MDLGTALLNHVVVDAAVLFDVGSIIIRKADERGEIYIAKTRSRGKTPEVTVKLMQGHAGGVGFGSLEVGR